MDPGRAGTPRMHRLSHCSLLWNLLALPPQPEYLKSYYKNKSIITEWCQKDTILKCLLCRIMLLPARYVSFKLFAGKWPFLLNWLW
jgi:hypothetical protein